MSDGGRSAEERERARLEREARRAAKRGEAPPPKPAAPEPPASERSHAPEPPASPVEQPLPAAPAPLERDEPVEVATEARPPEPPLPFEEAAPRRATAVPERGARSASERRAAAREFLHGRRGGGGGRGGRVGGPWRGSPSGRPRVAIVAVAGGLVVLAVAWFLLSLFQPFKGDGSSEVSVTIPRGASTGEIAEILEQKGVIASAFFFRARTTLDGSGADFKAGEIPMREDMSYGAAIDALSDPAKPDTVTITIPEGLSRSEIRDLVGDSLRGDYMRASLRSPRLEPAAYGGKNAKNLEGFLFPATYELKPGQPVGALVDRQLDTFKRELAQVDLGYAKSKNLTAYDVLTIASMIDREAQLPKERAIVASVIYNRLSQGIPLGIDATIRFATGNWSEPLKQSELAIDSGYNTRTNQGLPPGPIGNPGLAAMKAAARPAKTDYIYYVVKPCGNGAHAFSSSDAEFQQDVERYNAERERQGGNSPTDC
ncbi:MAG TPA: endolytic transglycosylase MltG [Thermoleophilaceae bacterium]|nr:endolytic transglycosylase MltG [Thermoleophilaceae bacterium]